MCLFFNNFVSEIWVGEVIVRKEGEGRIIIERLSGEYYSFFEFFFFRL